jgi:protoheme IX farnesyltransferase
VGGFVALTKPRIIELLLVSTVPTMVVAAGGIPSVWLMVITVLGGTLAAGGANAINMWIDRDIDAVMDRTKNRPLVTGVVRPTEALVFAVAIEIAAFVVLWLWVNLLSAILALAACLFYVFVYSLWLKRRTRSNIVIGGAAGAVPVLIGWSSVTNGLGWAPWLLFAVIFLWTPPHTWALAHKYREDYSRAEVPMLPSVASEHEVGVQVVAYSVLMVGVTLALAPAAHLGWVYLVSAAVLGAVFLWFAVAMYRDHSKKTAMRLFGYSISYVTLLFGAMAADRLISNWW